MSLPETCPFCGAEPYITASGNQCRGGDRWVLLSCGTSIYAGQDLRRTQSRKCEEAERTRLAARVAELEAENKQARDDEAWAHDKIMPVDFAPVESGWEAGWWDGEKRISATAPTIHAAIRALREKLEAKP